MTTDMLLATPVIGCFVVIVALAREVTSYPVVVETDKGLVEGKTHHVHGKRIDVFYGIPYARPPVGNLRFLHPEQIDPWSNTRDATTLPNCCMQQPDKTFGNFSGSNIWNPNTNISEDCLYLNIWTPHQHRPKDKPHSTSSQKAVLVWVYGGSFNSGSASLDIYDGRFLAAEYDVVVVSMQFRVGSLGYFALGAPHSPGNAGIMDIRMSLEWTQRNIHRFGGNAHEVTLVGESSGAASIGLMMLSPIGRGLFHRAILQSAGPQLKWATQSFEEGRRGSLALAKRLGCNTDRSHLAILSCLRQVPATQFPAEEGYVTEGYAQFPFVPVVDGTFLSKTPVEYLRNGEFKKIPLLLGANADEGSWLLVYSNGDHFNRETESLVSPDTYNTLVDQLFRYYPRYPMELNYLGLEAIKFQYTDWSDPTDQAKRRDAIVQATGDVSFSCGVVQMAQVASHHKQDVYLYRFSHRMSNHAWSSWMGVMHGDEIFFTFGRPLVKSLGFSSLERKLSKKIMTMWTNFAKTGNPNTGPGESDTAQWPKYQPKGQSYLEIDLDLVQYGSPDTIPPTSVHHGFLTQQCAFWEHYLPKVAQIAASSLYTNCSSILSASTSSHAVLHHATTSGLLLLSISMMCILALRPVL